MSRWDWNDALRLPDTALAGGRRIPKTVLTRQAMLTKTEQKALDKVAGLTHFATVQKSTTRIPPRVDEGHDIQSVVFLACEMAQGSRAFAETARLLHGCFPNPTVILFGGEGQACVSVALTRRSQAEQGAMVVERVEGTGPFDALDARYAPFLDTLAFDRLPQGDLLAYLEGLAWNVRLCRAMPSLGFFAACDEAARGRLDALMAERDGLAAQVENIQRRRRDRSLALNDSAKLRVEQKALERDLARVSAAIKEICHGGD